MIRAVDAVKANKIDSLLAIGGGLIIPTYCGHSPKRGSGFQIIPD
ncbi:hypothetical protein [Dickeya undicola]|nr:hypothetical protein [Dickeya undicola]